MRTWRLALVCVVAAMAPGCTRLVDGAALPPVTEVMAPPPGGVDVGRILLDTPRLRGVTGTDEQLTIIPTMDSPSPVDIDELAATVPPPCRFVYAETAVYGTGHTGFHKTTYQYPPRGSLIAEGAAVYPDADAAHAAFDALVATVAGCAETPAGLVLVGDWRADADSLHLRSGRCGSDYRVKADVLLEVTFCGFGDSVSELVIENMAAAVPG